MMPGEGHYQLDHKDRPRDQFYVSEIFVEKPNVELLDEENSYPIGIMNGWTEDVLS